MKALILLFPVFCLLVGCSSIRSKQLVGKEPVDLSGSIGEVELSGIAGEWVDADGELSSVTVTHAKEGEILYASLNDDDEEPMKLQLRVSEDHVFVNFPADDAGERMWRLMKVNGEMNQILVWEPETERAGKGSEAAAETSDASETDDEDPAGEDPTAPQREE